MDICFPLEAILWAIGLGLPLSNQAIHVRTNIKGVGWFNILILTFLPNSKISLTLIPPVFPLLLYGGPHMLVTTSTIPSPVERGELNIRPTMYRFTVTYAVH